MIQASSLSLLSLSNYLNYSNNNTIVDKHDSQLFNTYTNYYKATVWLKTVYEQIVHNNGKLLIELDHQDSNLTLNSAQLVINILKSRTSTFSKQTEITFIILYLLVILFAIITNSLMLFIFCRSEKLKTIRNTFIINLAISDIMLCSICAPLTLIRIYDMKWHIGRGMCKLGPGLQSATVLASAFSITAIAADRYQCIVYPGNDITKKIGAFGCSLIVWLLAILLCIPSFIVNDLTIVKWKYNNEILLSICQESWKSATNKYIYCIFNTLTHFVLPFLIISITNFQICYFLEYKVPSAYVDRRKSNLVINSLSDRKQTTSSLMSDLKVHRNDSLRNSFTSINYEHNSLLIDQKRFNHINRILTIVALSFAICWLPLVIINFMADTDWTLINGEKFAVIFLVCHLIAMTSSCINPILYGILNTNFKEELFSILFSNLTNSLTFRKTSINIKNQYNEIDNDAFNYGTTTKSSRLVSKTSLFNMHQPSIVDDENTHTLSQKSHHKSSSSEFFTTEDFYNIYKIDEEMPSHNSSLHGSKRNSISNSELNKTLSVTDKHNFYGKLLVPNYTHTLHSPLRKKKENHEEKKVPSATAASFAINLSDSILTSNTPLSHMTPEIIVTSLNTPDDKDIDIENIILQANDNNNYTSEPNGGLKHVDSDSDR